MKCDYVTSTLFHHSHLVIMFYNGSCGYLYTILYSALEYSNHGHVVTGAYTHRLGAGDDSVLHCWHFTGHCPVCHRLCDQGREEELTCRNSGRRSPLTPPSTASCCAPCLVPLSQNKVKFSCSLQSLSGYGREPSHLIHAVIFVIPTDSSGREQIFSSLPILANSQCVSYSTVVYLLAATCDYHSTSYGGKLICWWIQAKLCTATSVCHSVHKPTQKLRQITTW